MKHTTSMRSFGIAAVVASILAAANSPSPIQAQENNWMQEYVRLRVLQKNLSAVPANQRARMSQFMDEVIKPKIVGGDNATPNENPFQVALLLGSISNNADAQFCGGSLVSSDYVVTAAHCSDFVNAADVQVLTGARRLDGTGVRRNVEEITIHPDWNDSTFDSDVAVWRLQSSTSGIALAELATGDGEVGADLLATGWGHTTQGGTSPIDLQAVEVPLVSMTNCNDANSYSGLITNNMICAGTDAGGIDSCQGDSGGPLTRGPGNVLLTGITSWGFGCAQPNLPGVYTRVSSPQIRTFIEGVIGGDLYQLHRSGAIWRFTGAPCSGVSCPGWQRLDSNVRTEQIAVGASQLYQRHNNGAIWRFTGTSCSANSCPGWQSLDRNSRTMSITAGGENLYQLHNTGAIWRYTGTPCSGSSCPGWQRLDNNPRSVQLAASADNLYQLHNDGAIWRHTGTPCSGNSCPGWQRLDNNPRTTAIAAAGGDLYQLHNDGAIWRHTGTPCSGNSCPGWQRLDNNPRTTAIAAAGGDLYQLHNDGAIWRHTGTPCSGNSCPGWQRLDNNPRTTAIAAAGGDLYQLHNDGAIWHFTGTPCSGDTCPGWQRLDSNALTSSIVAN